MENSRSYQSKTSYDSDETPHLRPLTSYASDETPHLRRPTSYASDETPHLYVRALTRYYSDATPHVRPLTSYYSDETPHVRPLTSYYSNETLHIRPLTSYYSDETPHVRRLTSYASDETPHVRPLTSYYCNETPHELRLRTIERFVVERELSLQTTYQRSAKGSWSIVECHLNGNYITLENTSRKEESLSGWRINRVIDGRNTNIFLPQGFRVPGGQKARIYGTRNQAECSSPNDIVVNIHQWGVGANITTKLVNPNNEDRATHQQKSIYIE